METLRALRRSRALTFLDLAALSGIPARQLLEIEYGLRRLSAEQHETLALVLGLLPTELTASQQYGSGAYAATAPRTDQPPFQLLAAAALAATLATAGVVGVPELHLSRRAAPGIIASAPAAPATAEPVAGALATLDTIALSYTGSDAAALRRRTQAILTLRASLPAVALSPRLLVTATPPEHVAPAPRPAAGPAPAFVLTDAGPLGCPVVAASGQVVITQGYGTGTHAPAAIWGAVDLAVDGNGDGYADPGASWYTPIVATHDGHVVATYNSYPGGNYVAIHDPSGIWRTGYGHLAIITVLSGQFVRAGEQIGLMGNSGLASGPHLDYQVWRSGINVDPSGLVGCTAP